MALMGRFAGRPGGALTLSIALNLFLGGALLGLWIGSDGATAPRPGNGVEYSMAEFVRDLPGQSRRRIAAALDQNGAQVSRRIAALTRARARVVSTLGAEPYDPAAPRRAFVALRESSRDVQAAMHRIVSQVTDGLGARERAQLARSMFAAVPRRGEEAVTLQDVPLL